MSTPFDELSNIESPPRARVYIDGYNLFYGALKGKQLQWLNLEKLADGLHGSAVERVIFCTARVSGKGIDPQRATRQDVYLRALRTLPRVEVLEGQFSVRKTAHQLRTCCDTSNPCFVRTLKWEEKGSDVNLAVRLVHDGHTGLYERAYLVTGDSDLAESVRILVTDIKKEIVVINPRKRKSRELASVATEYRTLDRQLLRHSQFPEIVPHATQTICRPPKWGPPDPSTSAKPNPTDITHPPCCPQSQALVTRKFRHAPAVPHK